MGYSCTRDASLALGCVRHIFGDPKQGNVLSIKGKQYFFERGRENADGAITGTVFLMLPGDMARKAGTFRIEPDGTVRRFAGLSATNREEATNTFRDMSARNPQLMHSWAIGTI
jgi:hypothetical protein